MIPSFPTGLARGWWLTPVHPPTPHNAGNPDTQQHSIELCSPPAPTNHSPRPLSPSLTSISCWYLAPKWRPPPSCSNPRGTKTKNGGRRRTTAEQTAPPLRRPPLHSHRVRAPATQRKKKAEGGECRHSRQSSPRRRSTSSVVDPEGGYYQYFHRPLRRRARGWPRGWSCRWRSSGRGGWVRRGDGGGALSTEWARGSPRRREGKCAPGRRGGAALGGVATVGTGGGTREKREQASAEQGKRAGTMNHVASTRT